MRARLPRERRLMRLVGDGAARERVLLPDYGLLRIGGPGADEVGVGAFYMPVDATFSAQGPVCVGGACSSVLQLSWTRNPCVLLMVTLMSNGVARPGAAPGTRVNGIGIALGPGRLGARGLDYVGVGEACTLQALGLALDPQARTLRFAATRVPAWTGGPEVVLDGTLRY